QRRAADRLREIRKSIVGEDPADRGRKRLRIARRHRVEPMIPIGRDAALAARVDKDPRDRRGDAVEPDAAGTIDALAREPGENAVADRLASRRSAKPPNELRPAAPPRACGP